MRREDVFGYVLAGGRSRRMGRDKAMLPFRGKTLIEHALAVLQPVVCDVAIVGDRPDLARFAEIVPDATPDAGPVAGLVAGLRHCGRDWALFIPVDVPLLSAETLREMLEEAERRQSLCVVPASNGVQHPLCAVLHRALLTALETQLLRGECKVIRALEGAAGERLVQMQVQDAAQFSNFNTPEDVAEYDREEELIDEF